MQHLTHEEIRPDIAWRLEMIPLHAPIPPAPLHSALGPADHPRELLVQVRDLGLQPCYVRRADYRLDSVLARLDSCQSLLQFSSDDQKVEATVDH